MRKLLVLLGLLVLLPLNAVAQDDAAPSLQPGTQSTGSLDAENFAQTYVFSGSVGDTISITATTESTELELALFLTGPEGGIVAQAFSEEDPQSASITDYNLSGSGQYVLTVLRANELTSDASGGFTVSMTGTLTTPVAADDAATVPSTDAVTDPVASAPAETASLPDGGIEITLGWQDAVNMNLEVRDPIGGSIFRGSETAPSGGQLDADINADCTTATADNPTERIAWPAGEVPAGSYEVIIHYVDGCDITVPQRFDLSASVNGDEAAVIPGTLNPGQDYLANLIIDPSGAWTFNFGGVNAGLNISLLSQQIAAAQPLPGNTVVDNISRLRPAIAYTFEGNAGQNVLITMDRASGNLDTFLILLAPDGSEIARNDDRDDVVTDSTINTALTQDGTFTIVATRYGQTIGGTEGQFTLNFSQGAGTVVADPLATDPSVTDPTVTDPAVTDPTVTDPTVTDPLATDPTVTDPLLPSTLPEGSIEVSLTWGTLADVQLLVRDPLGDAVFDDNVTSTSGGVLSSAGNARCESTTQPISYVSWPTTRFQPGIYEIEVWYQANCDDNSPVIFDLNVNFQGEDIITEQQPIALDSRYMITFEVDFDGNFVVGPGGFFNMNDITSTNYFEQLEDATLIEFGDTTPDQITSDIRLVIYAFEAQTGDRIRISMQRTSGTLDPAVYLISPEGLPQAFNDDIIPGEDTNSLIDSFTVESTGRYFIIATHYGLQYGGTTGNYNLSLFQLPPEN